MPRFTIITSIELPDDELDRAEAVIKIRPLIGVINDWLTERKIEGSKVTYSFDGRSGPRKPQEQARPVSLANAAE